MQTVQWSRSNNGGESQKIRQVGCMEERVDGHQVEEVGEWCGGYASGGCVRARSFPLSCGCLTKLHLTVQLKRSCFTIHVNEASIAFQMAITHCSLMATCFTCCFFFTELMTHTHTPHSLTFPCVVLLVSCVRLRDHENHLHRISSTHSNMVR